MGHATEEEEELKSEEIISHSKIMLPFHSTLCLKKDPRHFQLQLEQPFYNFGHIHYLEIKVTHTQLPSVEFRS